MTQLRILWHSGFYNGPLSGLALLTGKRSIGTCHGDDADRFYTEWNNAKQRSSGPGLAAACMKARADVTSRRRNGVW